MEKKCEKAQAGITRGNAVEKIWEDSGVDQDKVLLLSIEMRLAGARQK